MSDDRLLREAAGFLLTAIAAKQVRGKKAVINAEGKNTIAFTPEEMGTALNEAFELGLTFGEALNEKPPS